MKDVLPAALSTTDLPVAVQAVLRILRMLPPFRGKARLARRLLRGALESAVNVVAIDRYGCRFVVPAPMEPIAFHLLTDGAYEGEQVEFVRRTLGPRGIFVDVGAGIGTYTVPVGRAWPEGRVVAIEPSPRNAAYIRSNVLLNGLLNVRIHQCGISNIDSVAAEFYEAPVRHFGMSSFAALPWIKPAASKVNVAVRTLDGLLTEEGVDRVDVVKVDVEGMEARVFDGAARLLGGTDSPIVVFEFTDWAEQRVFGHCGESQRVLRDHGYAIWRFRDLLRGRPPLRNVVTEGSAMFVPRQVRSS